MRCAHDFYESPYRVVKTLQQFAEVFGEDRQVSCCREISKLHEESVRGTLAEVIAHFEETEPRGEFVIVLAGKDPKQLKEELKEKRREERKNRKTEKNKIFCSFLRYVIINHKLIKGKDYEKLLMMACLAALVLTGCKDGKTTAGIGAAQNDSLNSIIAQKDSELNDLMGTINEIEDGLNQINEAENRVTLLKNGEGASKKQKLTEDVQFIATRMKQNKELIAKLQKQMANSSISRSSSRRLSPTSLSSWRRRRSSFRHSVRNWTARISTSLRSMRLSIT